MISLVADRIKAVQEQETSKAQAKTEQMKKEIQRTREVRPTRIKFDLIFRNIVSDNCFYTNMCRSRMLNVAASSQSSLSNARSPIDLLLAIPSALLVQPFPPFLSPSPFVFLLSVHW